MRDGRRAGGLPPALTIPSGRWSASTKPSKQLVKETRTPIPAAPGRPATIDYEYERNGTANLFMMFEPLAGRRHVKVTERRTAVDYAQVMRDLVDVHYPQAREDRAGAWTTSTRTNRRRSTRRFRPSGGSAADREDWRSTTRPSTAVGSTWPRRN